MSGLPLLATALMAFSNVGVAPPTDTVTAFVDVSVIPMNREQVLEHQTVLVQGNRITALGPAQKIQVPDEAKKVDGRGKYLIPGLADMHVHISVDLDSGSEAVPKDIERRLFALVANGVTTIRLMSGEPGQLVVRRLIREGKLLGPTMYVGSPQILSLDSPAEAI